VNFVGKDFISDLMQFLFVIFILYLRHVLQGADFDAHHFRTKADADKLEANLTKKLSRAKARLQVRPSCPSCLVQLPVCIIVSMHHCLHEFNASPRSLFAATLL
jgi:hypothetical protein